MSTENVQEQKIPTKEELIAAMKEQIEIKTVQAELQKLNRDIAVSRAEELKALEFIAQMLNPSAPQGGGAYQGGQLHIITQEDMDANPDLAEQGIKVGDEVMIPKEAFEQQASQEESKKKTLKKK